jgi:hypothetical protein
MMMFAPPAAGAGMFVNFIMMCVYLGVVALIIGVLEAGSFSGCQEYPNTSYGDNACPDVPKYVAPVIKRGPPATEQSLRKTREQ